MESIHGGNLTRFCKTTGRPTDDLIDFSANINPLGFPESLRRVISRNVKQLSHYPDPDSRELREAVAGHLNIEKEQIVLGNGSTEILYAIPRALDKKRVIIPVPSYVDYETASSLAGLKIELLFMDESEGFQLDLAMLTTMIHGDEIVFVGQPNNPTGRLSQRSDLLDFIASYPDTFFVIDESFAEFVPGYESVATHGAGNLVMVRSLTKFYAIPGLRIGYGCAVPELAERIKKYILPWTVNTLAQSVTSAFLRDKEYAEQTRSAVPQLRKKFAKDLTLFTEFTVYPSDVNFLLVQIVEKKWTSAELAEKTLQQGIAIRVCDNFNGLPESGKYFFRVAVRTEEENNKLISTFKKILSNRPKLGTSKKKFSLMFQGTASNAGKSVLTAAMCRILLQDGFRVAPFKSQNMSLNSYVTMDGLEMGRAQVVQAQACRLDPDVRMNPVLLKPSSDVGCQVIVNGLPAANMSVGEYVLFKEKAWREVCVAYDSLYSEYDGVILEGAGSPGEVNLKDHDIVNMRMAQYAKAPVLLTGDIDRGGVFASFVGTMEVLAEWERSLIAGFVVNRFRGKESLLGDAFQYVEGHTGLPVIGVIPYLQQLGLPEEDSVSFKSGLYDSSPPEGDYVEIGLIDLPHISNFTDFEPFLAEPDVHLKIIRNPADIEAIQDDLAALILPGSKNVIADMEYLLSSGLADLICSLADIGKIEVVGICGGFQMLGGHISDPHCLESNGRGARGLGLLDMSTSLAQNKTLQRRTATHVKSGVNVSGYEIHHGITNARHIHVLIDDNDKMGASSENAMIWGSYLHGIFDSDLFRRWFIDLQRKRNGLQPIEKILSCYDLEPAFDRLAKTVRQGLNMDKIYKLLGV